MAKNGHNAKAIAHAKYSVLGFQNALISRVNLCKKPFLQDTFNCSMQKTL